MRARDATTGEMAEQRDYECEERVRASARARASSPAVPCCNVCYAELVSVIRSNDVRVTNP